MTALTEEQAKDVYDVLVEFAGADPDNRDQFVYALTKEQTTEYRFQGSLGFGGKFWNDRKWYVTCYREDRTPERTSAMRYTNALLGWLYKRSQRVAS